MDCIYFETVFNEFASEGVVTQNIFSLLPNALRSRINSCYNRRFSNLIKEHIIISRVNSSYMGPRYIETT